MRDMHKWKDKVELSLDNRQIFFLFFGLSVIGCFVFALGIMTGRRLEWEPGQQAAALDGEASLATLDEQSEDPEHFAFKGGLAEADTAEIPPTRDPSVPPRDEDEVKAERAEQALAAADAVSAELDAADAALARAAEPAVAEPAVEPAPSTAVEPAVAPARPGGPSEAEPPAAEAPGKRVFTLQMKAFSRQADADKLAAKLTSNGHDARVEAHEVRGRTWHRVRVGSFTSWESALEAKAAFEKAEHIIAYVVSK